MNNLEYIEMLFSENYEIYYLSKSIYMNFWQKNKENNIDINKSDIEK